MDAEKAITRYTNSENLPQQIHGKRYSKPRARRETLSHGSRSSPYSRRIGKVIKHQTSSSAARSPIVRRRHIQLNDAVGLHRRRRLSTIIIIAKDSTISIIVHGKDRQGLDPLTHHHRIITIIKTSMTIPCSKHHVCHHHHHQSQLIKHHQRRIPRRSMEDHHIGKEWEAHSKHQL